MTDPASGLLFTVASPEAVRHERDFKFRKVKTGFPNINKCKPVLLRLSLAGNLDNPLMSLYGREHCYGLRTGPSTGLTSSLLAMCFHFSQP
jgi:hypothetical protein